MTRYRRPLIATGLLVGVCAVLVAGPLRPPRSLPVLSAELVAGSPLAIRIVIGCSGTGELGEVDVTESETAVVVDARAPRGVGPAMCGLNHQLDVPLDRPLGTRTVTDLNSSFRMTPG